jgi:hypothetical protein
MLEMHDDSPAPAGEPSQLSQPSRRRPLRRRVSTVSVPDSALPLPEPPPEPDRTAALLTHTEERYQALQLRLDRIEGAFRRLVQANRDAVRSTDHTARALLARIDALVTSVEKVAARQERAIRNAEARHRTELIEFAKRAGRAVGAATSTLHRDLASTAEEMRELDIALRESAQRQEALLRRHLDEVRARPEEAKAPRTPELPSPDGFDQIEDGLASVTGELRELR